MIKNKRFAVFAAQAGSLVPSNLSYLSYAAAAKILRLKPLAI
jgi:hypothetical protein